jgi:hypothetical protein
MGTPAPHNNFRWKNLAKNRLQSNEYSRIPLLFLKIWDIYMQIHMYNTDTYPQKKVGKFYTEIFIFFYFFRFFWKFGSFCRTFLFHIYFLTLLDSFFLKFLFVMYNWQILYIFKIYNMLDIPFIIRVKAIFIWKNDIPYCYAKQYLCLGSQSFFGLSSPHVFFWWYWALSSGPWVC